MRSFVLWVGWVATLVACSVYAGPSKGLDPAGDSAEASDITQSPMAAGSAQGMDAGTMSLTHLAKQGRWPASVGTVRLVPSSGADVTGWLGGLAETAEYGGTRPAAAAGFGDGGFGVLANTFGSTHANLATGGALCQSFGAGRCELNRDSEPYFAIGDEGKNTRLGADESGLGTAVVTPIPEPSTYALMVTGLLIIGAAVRRRCNAQE